MAHKDQFNRELDSRACGQFDNDFVVGVIRAHNGGDNESNVGDVDEEVRREMIRRGFAKYPYCLVMTAGKKSLVEILTDGQ